MRLFGSLVGVVAVATLAGCGSGSAVSASSLSPTAVAVVASSGPVRSPTLAASPSSTASPRPLPRKTPSPAKLYAQLRTVVLKAGTGAFSQRNITDLGDGPLTVVLDGSYDLKTRVWEGQLTYVSASATYLASVPDPSTLTTNYRAFGPDDFISLPAWPAALKGRWEQISTAQSEGAAAPLVGGPKAATPEMLAALLAVTPSHVHRTSTGWTLTGRIGAAHAVLGLGLAKAFRAQNVDVVGLKGSASVSIDVAATGQPTEMRISGTSVKLTSTVPAAARALLTHQHGVLDLLELGEPVQVSTPTGHQVIAPSELPAATPTP